MEYLWDIINSPKSIVFFSLDEDYRYLFFNSNHASIMKAIWGVDIEMGQSILSCINSSADLEKAKSNFDRALLGEEFTQIEEYGDKTLRRSFWENFYTPLKNDQNKIIGLTVFVTDITERRNAELKIQEHEDLLKSISDNISEGIFRSSSDRLIYANRALIRMFGYANFEEMAENNTGSFYQRFEDKQSLREVLDTVGFVTNREILFKRKDNSCFYGLMSSKKIQGKNGVTYFDGAVRDISYQKQTENRLKKQGEISALLFGISSKYLNITVKNVEKEIGVSLEEIGRFCKADRAYIFEIEHDKNLYRNTYEWVDEGISAQIQGSQGLSLKMMDSNPQFLQGDPIITENITYAEPVFYKNFLFSRDTKSAVIVPWKISNEVVGFIGFDYVRKSHRAEESEVLILTLFAEILTLIKNRTLEQGERERLLEKTTKQNDRFKDFSFITSHNIRSSVANFIALLDIQETNPTNPEINKMLKETAHKLNLTLSNVNELLNFENELEDMSISHCNLHQSIRHALETNNQLILENHARIKNQVDEDLMIEGYPAYVDSIFHNLITNAVKYGVTENSSKIEIRADSCGKLVNIEVKDYGLGIDIRKHGEKLFKLGSRFHADTKDGQGLGLFMIKRHVEAMGGSIGIESELNEGTTIKITLNAA